MKIAVSIHGGHAAIGEIGSSEPPMLMAIGEAIDVANDLRKAAAERDKAFAISEKVYTEAGLVPVAEDKITLGGGSGDCDNRVSLGRRADSVADLDAARRDRPPCHAAAAVGGRLTRRASPPCRRRSHQVSGMPRA